MHSACVTQASCPLSIIMAGERGLDRLQQAAASQRGDDRATASQPAKAPGAAGPSQRADDAARVDAHEDASRIIEDILTVRLHCNALVTHGTGVSNLSRAACMLQPSA